VVRPPPHKAVLVLNGHFPLVLHKKFREYDSIPGIFIFIQTKNHSIQNCSHPEGLDFGCSLSEKGKHNLTVCLPFLRENAPKDRFSGQNCLMWLWPYSVLSFNFSALSRIFPMRVIMGTTRALPIQK
jgi:hypothetical protein